MIEVAYRDVVYRVQYGRDRANLRIERLKFSEMQSSAFWTLEFSKCLDFILNCNAKIFNKLQVVVAKEVTDTL